MNSEPVSASNGPKLEIGRADSSVFAEFHVIMSFSTWPHILRRRTVATLSKFVAVPEFTDVLMEDVNYVNPSSEFICNSPKKFAHC